MSFRPWRASCGPLRGLSSLHSAIFLILSISSTSPQPLLFIYSTAAHCIAVFSLFPSYPFLFLRLPLTLSLLIIFVLSFLSSPSSTTFSAHSLPPAACPTAATRHCSAMIQKPHINTGISPRDYLSVACLPGRVLLCNLYRPMYRAGLGKEGIWWSLRPDWVLEWVQYELLGIFDISVPYGDGFKRWGW